MIITLFGSIIATIADIILFSILSKNSLLNTLKKHSIFLFFLILMLGNLNIIISFYPIPKLLVPITNIFLMLTFLISLNIYFYHPLRTTIIITLKFFLCSFLSELLSGLMFSFLLKVNILNLDYYNNLIFIFINILFKLFFIMIIKSFAYSFDTLSRAESLIIFINLLSSLIILGIYTCLIFVLNYHYIITSYFVFFSLSVICITGGTFIQLYVMRLLQKQRLEKENIEKEVKAYKAVIKNSIESQKSFKSIFHDFKNSVILIDKYVRNGEKNKATEYLKQIQNEISYIQGNQLHIYTSHEDLNYLLIAKKFYANSQNISVKIDCFLTDDTLISNDVIIVILGNLIDNAINACLADHYTIYKYIHLKIKQTDSNLNIIITNSVSPDVTKETLHEGTGIKNIKKIVNRNEGFYCRTLDYDVYTVKIILWGTNGNISNI